MPLKPRVPVLATAASLMLAGCPTESEPPQVAPQVPPQVEPPQVAPQPPPQPPPPDAGVTADAGDEIIAPQPPPQPPPQPAPGDDAGS